MLGSDGEPSRLKTDETEREGEKERTIYRAQLSQRSKAGQRGYAKLRIALILGTGSTTLRIESIPFFFLTLPRNEQVSNEMFARTGFPE